MLIQENLSIEEKLRILSDAAKYDAPAPPAAWAEREGKAFLETAGWTASATVLLRMGAVSPC